LKRRTASSLAELTFVGVILALVAVTAHAAVLIIVSKGWNADAAAWVQAAGSILAIGGAVWLSRDEARRARSERRQKSEEEAWGVRFVIAQAQFDAQIIAAALTKSTQPFGRTDIESWQQRAENSAIALQTMLTRSDYVHPFVVLNACNAKVLIGTLSANLQELEERRVRRAAAPDRLIQSMVYAHINLRELLDLHDARMRRVVQALDRGGDMLPMRELASNAKS
jgi:hypothetical protein